MKPAPILTAAFLIITTCAACVPRQVRPVSQINPSAMLEEVTQRRDTLESGLSGILETDFREGRRRFGGKAYIVAFPDGPFRLEIPGQMGNTLMVMVNDGEEVVVYYPGKETAYISPVDDPSINEHLPFPLPVGTCALAPLLLGTTSAADDSTGIKGYLLDSGEKRLWTGDDGSGLEFSYLFSGEQSPALRLVSAHGKGIELEVTTRKTPPYLPDRFTLTFQGTTITGSWEKAELFTGDRDILRIDLPGSVSVRDLR